MGKSGSGGRSPENRRLKVCVFVYCVFCVLCVGPLALPARLLYTLSRPATTCSRLPIANNAARLPSGMRSRRRNAVRRTACSSCTRACSTWPLSAALSTSLTPPVLSTRRRPTSTSPKNSSLPCSTRSPRPFPTRLGSPSSTGLSASARPRPCFPR